MAIRSQRSNMRMSEFRNEFLGTSSGEIKMSDLVRESGTGNGSTRNAGNTNSSFAGRLANNK